MPILTPNNNIFLSNSSEPDQNLTKAMQQERQNVQYNIQKQFMTGNHHLLKKGKSLSGRWSKSEHDRFIKGFQKFGRNWVEVQKVVKTRSLTQVRSHAQKVFLNSGNNGLNLSMQSQNSDQISYQDSSEVSQASEYDIKSKSQVNIQAKINLTKNSITQKQYLTVSCIQKQKQNQLTKQEQQRPSISSILPHKQLLEHYLNTHQQPSHFIKTVVQNFQYLSKGGNFIQLCLGQGQRQNGGEGV